LCRGAGVRGGCRAVRRRTIFLISWEIPPKPGWRRRCGIAQMGRALQARRLWKVGHRFWLAMVRWRSRPGTRTEFIGPRMARCFKAAGFAGAMLMLAGCRTVSSPSEVPAIIVNATPESRAALAQTVSEALNGAPVKLAADALTKT